MQSYPSVFLIITWLLLCFFVTFFTFKSLQSATSQSVYAVEPCTSPTPTATPTPTPTPTPAPVENVYLTEFMACPASGNEWLELYNGNDSSIEVVNWQIIDETGNKKYLNGTIAAQSFLQLEWSGSLLNNTGDSFTIYTSSGQNIGTASYDNCTTGISFVYESGNWVGAIKSPGQETSFSEASLPSSTTAAMIATTIHSEVPATTSTEIALTTESAARFNIPLTEPLLTTNAPEDQQPTYSLPPPKKRQLPTLSVIIGGLVQLIPSGIKLYGNGKKYLT